MAGVLQRFLGNSSSTQLLELLSRCLETPESKRDYDFYLSLKSVLITLKEHDKLLDNLAYRVTHELCLPVVRCGDSQANRHKIHIVYEIIALCCMIGSKDLVQEVTGLCLEGLSNHPKDITSFTGFPVVVCVDLISYLMKDDVKQVMCKDLLREMFDSLLVVLHHSDELMCMKITNCVLPLFLSPDTEEARQKVHILWRMIKEMSEDKHNVTADSHVKSYYAIMCSLAEFFITDSKNKNAVLCDSRFWELIQQGLIMQDPISSKRAMYILKRALDHIDKQNLCLKVENEQGVVIFNWNPQQRTYWLDIWQEFVLLMETLNETQVHVIKPVLPRISKILSATEFKQDGSQALDISWLTTIFSKASLHPNRFIRKWSVMEILTIDLSTSPLLLPINWSFLLGHFQTMLNEYSLFGKDYDGNPGKESPVGIALYSFYNLCLEFLPKDQHVDFLTKLIGSIENQKFSPVPMVFVSYALSNIQNASVLGSDALHVLRNVLLHLRTHAVHMRMATKGFLLTTAANLTKPNLLSWEAIYNFLATGKLEECLTRESWLWNKLCEWLRKIESDINTERSLSRESQFREGLFHFLGLEVERFLSNPAVHSDEAKALGRMIIAAGDSLHTSDCLSNQNNRSSPLVDILNKITQTLQDASTRLYMSETKLYKTTSLLITVLQVLYSSDKCRSNSLVSKEGSSSDYTTHLVSKSVNKAMPDILNLIHKKLTTTQEESISGNPYLDLCKTLHCFFASKRSLNSNCRQFYTFVENVAMISIKTIHRFQSSKSHELKEWLLFQQSMLFVAWCCEIISMNEKKLSASISEKILHAIPLFQLDVEFKKPVMITNSSSGETTFEDAVKSNLSWGNSVSGFISALWTTAAFFLQHKKDIHEEKASVNMVVITSQIKDVLGAALDALDITANVLPVITSIGLLIPKLLEVDLDSCSRAIDVVWKTLRDSWERISFWEEFPVFLSVIFSPVLLMLPDNHPLTKKVKSYLDALLSEGEIRPGVMHVVIQQLSRVWADDVKTDHHSSLLIHQDTIIKVLLFGPMIKKAQKIEAHVESYLRDLGNDSPLCVLTSVEVRDDTQVRVTMINILLSLDASKTHNQDLLKSVIRALIRRDKEIANSQTAVYISSQYHRKKHRAWQTVLMLLPQVLEYDIEGEYAKEILQSVFTSILDQNQLSVQNFQQWVILHILTRCPDLTKLLWDELLFDSDKRIGRVGLLCTCAMLFAIHCVAGHAKRSNFFSRALNAVFPWVTTNNRSVRVFAQVAVQRMWYCCVTENLVTVLQENAIIEPCLTLITEANDTLAEKIRLLENYFFFDFNPIKDFSVESIYLTIPKHSGMTEEEWVTPEEFQQSSLGRHLWKSSKRHKLPLCNEDRRLAEFVPMPYDFKEKVGVHFERRFREERKQNLKLTEDNSEFESEPESAAFNVQKKMIAWKIVPPEEVMMAELQQQRMLALQKSCGGNLIVVASLIDKAPNLGGLCRTSEIFGVRKLVLGSSEIMKDQNFKNLSVSSAKWVDVEQVRPVDLKGYLQDMRRQGYTLIGVEQTANSQPLTQYQFPHDALLLLGNEKEGIPADLIQLLDVCVEIPQVGIIRSLNVHVSGSLLIWEYTKQRLLTANTAE